jgi:hypothetical protein
MYVKLINMELTINYSPKLGSYYNILFINIIKI